MITFKIKALLHTVLIVFLSVIYVPFQVQAAEHTPPDSLLQQLIQVDKELNTVFKDALSRLDEKDKQTLRKEQKAWIKERDKKCGSAFKSKDMDDWLRNAAAKEECARCLLLESKTRMLEFFKRKKIDKVYELVSSKYDNREGKLEIKEISNDKLLFYLYCVLGTPSHNQGEISGEAQYVDGKAVYNTGKCKIIFSFRNNSVVVQEYLGDPLCAPYYGYGVHCEGEYRLKKKRRGIRGQATY